MSEKIYAVGTFNFDIDSIVKRAEQQRFNEANQKRQDGSSFRDSKVTWINKWPELEGYATRLWSQGCQCRGHHTHCPGRCWGKH